MLKSLASIFLLFAASCFPQIVTGQSYEQTRKFCRMSQMLIPIFLRGGEVPGFAVCEAAGGTSYECSRTISLAAGICRAGGGASYECSNSMSLGAGVCIAGGGASYECNNVMGLGAGVCIAGGGATYECPSSMKYAQGVCIAGGNPSYECTSSMSLGTAVCMSGKNTTYQCAGIGNDDLGEGICRALGGSASQCESVSVSAAICAFTDNCRGYDASSLAVSIVETCGVEVLSFGID